MAVQSIWFGLVRRVNGLRLKARKITFQHTFHEANKVADEIAKPVPASVGEI